MKIAYIAGPFRATNAWEIEQNIRRAEALSLEVWNVPGWCAICPHANTRFFQGAAPDKVWLDGDIEILRRCDAMILVPGWEKSSGTRAEVEVAIAFDIPVYDSVRTLRGDIQLNPEWLRLGPENNLLTSSVAPTS